MQLFCRIHFNYYDIFLKNLLDAKLNEIERNWTKLNETKEPVWVRGIFGGKRKWLRRPRTIWERDRECSCGRRSGSIAINRNCKWRHPVAASPGFD